MCYGEVVEAVDHCFSNLGRNWMRTWQKEIRILGKDFLIKKEIVESIIKEVEKAKFYESRSFYAMAQRKLFKYM